MNSCYFVAFSTVAASINALATVTYEDFVHQCCGNISTQAATWISKALCKYNRLLVLLNNFFQQIELTVHDDR